jgi:hypothetical protein
MGDLWSLQIGIHFSSLFSLFLFIFYFCFFTNEISAKTYQAQHQATYEWKGGVAASTVATESQGTAFPGVRAGAAMIGLAGALWMYGGYSMASASPNRKFIYLYIFILFLLIFTIFIFSTILQYKFFFFWIFLSTFRYYYY